MRSGLTIDVTFGPFRSVDTLSGVAYETPWRPFQKKILGERRNRLAEIGGSFVSEHLHQRYIGGYFGKSDLAGTLYMGAKHRRCIITA